jgi:hypothetical protein
MRGLAVLLRVGVCCTQSRSLSRLSDRRRAERGVACSTTVLGAPIASSCCSPVRARKLRRSASTSGSSPEEHGRLWLRVLLWLWGRSCWDPVRARNAVRSCCAVAGSKGEEETLSCALGSSVTGCKRVRSEYMRIGAALPAAPCVIAPSLSALCVAAGVGY